jgi:hypothetical protein
MKAFRLSKRSLIAGFGVAAFVGLAVTTLTTIALRAQARQAEAATPVASAARPALTVTVARP